MTENSKEMIKTVQKERGNSRSGPIPRPRSRVLEKSNSTGTTIIIIYKDPANIPNRPQMPEQN